MQSESRAKIDSSTKNLPRESVRKLPKAGPTIRNLGVTGKVSSHHGKINRTKGKFSTTTTNLTDEREIITIKGIEVDVTPMPLIILAEEEKGEKKDGEQTGSLKASSSERKESEASASQSRSEIKYSEIGGSSLLRSADQSEVFSEVSDETGRDVKAAEETKTEDKGLKEEDLDKLVDINLNETETFTLFYLPSIAVSAKSETKELSDADNEKYKLLLKEKIASDNFQMRPAQTTNLMPKVKEVVTETIKRHEFDCEVTEWMLHDAFLEEIQPAHEQVAKVFSIEVNSSLNDQLKHRGTLLDPESSLTETYSLSISQTQPSNQLKDTGTTSKAARESRRVDQSSRSVLSSSSVEQSKRSQTSAAHENEPTPFRPPEDIILPDSLLAKFNIVERILTQNRYLEQQILYRNYPKVEFTKVVEEEKQDDKGKSKIRRLKDMVEKKEEKKEEEKEDEDEGATKMIDLFKFQCSEVENRLVSCADWNTLNPDLLAVSYGEHDPYSRKPGKLLFWTLKSPKFPERIIEAPTGLISCHFSKNNPSLIATGSYDGVVAIYDVRKKDNKPVAESSQMLEKHIDTVWEVRWHDQGSEKGENLISISSDGRITEWSIKKGLECRDLLNLKKPTNPNQKDDKEAAVFRNAVGFSLDFPRDQNLLYLASTEEGTIHKCSLSYNDELDTYWGHAGPVYKVRCNPFWSNIMLTCSADWTVQIWDWRREENSIMTCQAQDLRDAVNDIEWSPHDSTIFSSVADDGRIELWDLSDSNTKPIVTRKPENRDSPRTMVRFCKEFPVLVSGNAAGVVDVLRLKYPERPLMTKEEQKKKLEKAVYPAGRAGKDGIAGDEDEEEMEEQAE
ncbi:unnamed protein product [Blepharisma stoltei]|uniref:Dynein axonemal intermediate chain 4 n=1 Tax=Blepharisma stoltei TaxID=1481888 RepID=A0AAU9JZQ7_9CILI|nr:unnamed protein product [Blepharisma stoltei]